MGRGGVMGVASKSKDTSIRIYNGRTHYNEWQFVTWCKPRHQGRALPALVDSRNAAGKTIRDPVGWAASADDREVQAVRVRALVVPADREETHRSAVPSVVQEQAGDSLARDARPRAAITTRAWS